MDGNVPYRTHPTKMGLAATVGLDHPRYTDFPSKLFACGLFPHPVRIDVPIRATANIDGRRVHLSAAPNR